MSVKPFLTDRTCLIGVVPCLMYGVVMCAAAGVGWFRQGIIL
jgi:hypothetical protein